MQSIKPHFEPLLGYGYLQESSILQSGKEWRALYTCSNNREIYHHVIVGPGYARIQDDAGIFNGTSLAEAVAQRFRTIHLPDDPVYERWKKPMEDMPWLSWPEYTDWARIYYHWVGHLWIIRITTPKVGWPLFQNHLKAEEGIPEIYHHYLSLVHQPKASLQSLGIHPAWVYEFLMPSVLVPNTLAQWYDNGYLPPWQRYPISIQLYADHMIRKPKSLKLWNLEAEGYMEMNIRFKQKK